MKSKDFQERSAVVLAGCKDKYLFQMKSKYLTFFLLFLSTEYVLFQKRLQR